MANTIKIGKIEVEVNSTPSNYIPNGSKDFIDHGEILKTIALGIRDNLPVLLIGESGVGKSSAVRYLAEKTNNGLRRINLNGGTTADELVGRQLLNDHGTYWVDGVLTDAMRKGEWVVLDEINAALPEVLFVLQSIMDDDGYLVLNEKDDREIVKKHPNFRLFATCNPPEYAGTKEMNKSLLSRFPLCINAEFPTPAKELEIIKHHLGAAVSESELSIKLVGFANETRKSKEIGNADYAINTRDILNTLRLSNDTEPMEAFALAFANKLDVTDNKALMATARLHLPTTKKKAMATRKEVKQTNEITIGKNYILNGDMQGAYIGMSSDKKIIGEWKQLGLGDIIGNISKENAVKNDEFKVTATFYENATTGASEKEETALGDKVASMVEFTEGGNKGQTSIIIHHPAVGESAKIINNLYEIS
ncbi:MAG: AAA family ATPase [Candidatus Nanoarchaeia archaeon]|nr:AAA family ATPase [Candidatus Nanoarchaeia archaeon]